MKPWTHSFLRIAGAGRSSHIAATTPHHHCRTTDTHTPGTAIHRSTTTSSTSHCRPPLPPIPATTSPPVPSPATRFFLSRSRPHYVWERVARATGAVAVGAGFGPSDLLTGNGSRLDIENINLLATLLIHAEHQGYWGKLGEQFEESMQSLLDRHLLAGVGRAFLLRGLAQRRPAAPPAPRGWPARVFRVQPAPPSASARRLWHYWSGTRLARRCR
jgi:hypothetical protein